MRLSFLLAIGLAPPLVTACSANTNFGLRQSGSASAGAGNGTSGAGGGGLQSVGVGVGSGSGSGSGGMQGTCDPAVDICGDEIKTPTTCDDGLQLTDPDPMHAAKAIDLCHVAQNGGWGVVSAKYVRADGSAAKGGDLARGLAQRFGDNIAPQLGKSMLVLSSGYARDTTMPGNCGSESCKTFGAGTAPASFPQDVPSCNGAKNINDDIALEVALKAPNNAKGYSFNFAFMSFEFPQWVCTPFNDQFIALVTPAPMGSINGNISFDSKKNPVSVNIALFDHCDPASQPDFPKFCALTLQPSCPGTPNPYCPNGDGFLAGTGWGTNDGWIKQGDSEAGSTGWLATTAPIQGGAQFTIRFAIWDTGDQNLDSTVVIDNFRWSADPININTNPVPNPK